MESDMKCLSDIRVFGYGSILWNPGFNYTSCTVGYVEGYSRRFWQGSIYHRGTPDKSKTWGMMYHIVGRSMVELCLEHLGARECHLGGYKIQSVLFYPSTGSSSLEAGTKCHQAIQAWAFVAPPENNLYLGPASIEQLAKQVLECRGVSGCNAEYVTRLADFIRVSIPEDDDRELFALDSEIKKLTTESSSSLNFEPHNDLDVTSAVTVTPTPTGSTLIPALISHHSVVPQISVRAC